MRTTTPTRPARGGAQPLGAYHSAINRLVHDVPSSLDPDQLALQTQVLAQWNGFAATGSPNAASTPLWTTYNAEGGPVMSEQAGGASQMMPTATIAAEHHCSFWNMVDRNAPWSVNG
jgi:para-nitrobenzyl esterase